MLMKKADKNILRQIFIMMISAAWGIFCNFCVFLSCAYDILGEDNSFPVLVFLLFCIVHFVVSLKDELPVFGIISFCAAFISTLNVFRKKYYFCELILKEDFEKVFSEFQLSNPLYYAGVRYFEYIFIIIFLYVIEYLIYSFLHKEKSEKTDI